MIWIGTSGWVYKHWIGCFYGRKLPQREWLSYYADHFATVEINRSFYRLPTYEQFKAWAEQTAAHPGFLYTVKASRYITHMKKLKDPGEPIERLMASARGLGKQLGPFLYQLPPHWQANPERLEQFIQRLPREYRAAFEFRDPSWFQPEMLPALTEILRSSQCALVIAVGGNCPTPLNAPAVGTFRFLRFHHGAQGIGLTDEELVFWARRIRKDMGANPDMDVFAYFNNDPDGHAIKDAMRLRELLEQNA